MVDVQTDKKGWIKLPVQLFYRVVLLVPCHKRGMCVLVRRLVQF